MSSDNTKQAAEILKYFEETAPTAIDFHTEVPLSALRPTGTPITDAFREKIKTDPAFAQQFADIGNATAAALRTSAESGAESDEKVTSYFPFETWEKVELRVGLIVDAERVAGSKGGKLLKLTVDFGEATARTVVSGIGLTFAPEQLVSRGFAFVTNLAPRKMMGIESQAMILATGKPEALSLCEVAGAEPGGRLG